MIKFLIIILLVSIRTVIAETFYVCQGGSGASPTVANCGTAWDDSDFNAAGNWANPKQSGKIGPGDTVNFMVAGGTFGRLTPQGSGDSGSPIIFQPYSTDSILVSTFNDDAIILSSGCTCDYQTWQKGSGAFAVQGPTSSPGGVQAGFYINEQSNITIDGLTFTGVDAENTIGVYIAGSTDADHTVTNITVTNYSWGVFVGSTGDNITLSNSTLTSALNDGFATGSASNATDITITGNTSHSNARQGMELLACNRCLVTGNTMYGNGASGIQVETGATNIIVRNNTMYGNSQIFLNETGIWIDETQNALVEQNTVHSNAICIAVTETDQAIVRFNKCYENQENAVSNNQNFSGLRMHGKDSKSFPWGTGSNYYFYHNILDDNGFPVGPPPTEDNTACILFMPLGGEVEDMTDGEIEIANNVVYDCEADHDVAFSVDGQAFNGNYYYHPSRSTSFRWNGVNKTAAEWEAIHTTDSADGTTDPLFTNVASNDYTIQASSPMVDIAVHLTTVSSVGASTITAADARWFTDGYGITGESGDLIAVFTTGWALRGTATVTSVNYSTNVLTVDGVPPGTTSGDYIVYARDFNNSTLQNRPEVGGFWFVPVSTPGTAGIHAIFLN